MTYLSESPQHDADTPRLWSAGTRMVSSSTTASSTSSSSRKVDKGWVLDINKYNLMAKHLYRNCKKNNWLDGNSNEACVALRTFQGDYILFPPEDRDGK